MQLFLSRFSFISCLKVPNGYLQLKAFQPGYVVGSRTGSWLLNYGSCRACAYCQAHCTLRLVASALLCWHNARLQHRPRGCVFLHSTERWQGHGSLLGLGMRQQLSVFFSIFARNTKKQFKCSVANRLKFVFRQAALNYKCVEMHFHNSYQFKTVEL